MRGAGAATAWSVAVLALLLAAQTPARTAAQTRTAAASQTPPPAPPPTTAGRASPTTGQADLDEDRDDDEAMLWTTHAPHAYKTPRSASSTPSKAASNLGSTASTPASDGRCSASDDRDCPPETAAITSGAPGEDPGSDRRLNNYLYGKPVVPDEDPVEVGFLYARSLSVSLEDDPLFGPAATPRGQFEGRTVRNRAFGQTWCSATLCPVSAALTLSNSTHKHSARKGGQGEALVACLDCTFSAASVSIVDGETVCAAASSSNLARGVCVAVCHWEGMDCTCSSGCSAREVGSENIHTYGYQVTAATSLPDLLNYLHRLLVRIHNTAEHLGVGSDLDIVAKTRKVRANVEARFGKEKAKAVPLLYPSPVSSGLQ